MLDALKSLNWALIVILALIVIGSWVYFCRISIAEYKRKNFWKIVSLVLTLGWAVFIVCSICENWPSRQTDVFDASGQLISK